MEVLPQIINNLEIAEVNPGVSRSQILAAEDKIRSLPDQVAISDIPLEHLFAAGVYGRKIIIPAGIVMTGKIHKHECINVILKGKVEVATHDSATIYEGPISFISSRGSKRVLHTLEETHWMTFHGTTETDIEKIDEEFVCETFEEYDAFINTQLKIEKDKLAEIELKENQLDLFQENKEIK